MIFRDDDARTRRRRRGARLRWWIVALIVLFGLFGLAAASSQPRDQAVERQLASDVAPTASPVQSDRRLILTFYFYWYDATTGAHLEEGSGLRHHLPSDPTPSWRNVAWHKKELADMAWAGIDIALPVYWGFDRPDDAWSSNGLDVIAQAWRELDTEGKNPPGIGMFLDTTIVDRRDLTTSEGKRWFYANFHDFFSRIPREQWGLVNGRPVVFLFTSDYTGAMDQTTFDYVYEQFEADFGVRPYIVRENSWSYPILRWENGERVRDYQNPIVTENSYPWATSIFGYADLGGVASVGPGYDDTLVPGRNRAPTDREDGEFYRRNFKAAIASGKPLLVIETWNEIHEGSGISETVEFGRKYLAITRELAAEFHAAGQ